MLVQDLMTVLICCTPWDTAKMAASLMKAQGIALHAPAAQVTKTIKGISKPVKPRREMHFEKACFYCGQPHEQDQILLLNRRRELTPRHEVLI